MWTRSEIGPAAPAKLGCEYTPIPPLFAPVSPSPIRFQSQASGSGRTSPPAAIAIADTSRPASRSSITSFPNRGIRSSTARCASSMSSGTTTPLPAAKPSALTTGRSAGPSISSHLCAAFASVKTSPPAWGAPAAAITSLAKAFDDSIRAAAADGPKVGTPAARKRSASPSASGSSGPITARSTLCSLAACAIPSRSIAAIGRFSPSAAVPALPGAQTSPLHSGLRETAQASACSRPPPPTIRTFICLSSTTAQTRTSFGESEDSRLACPLPAQGRAI